jgi:hypothetical protein
VGARVSGVGGASLNSPGVASLACGPREPARAVGLDGGARHSRVLRGHGSTKGMTGGPQRSATVGAGGGGARGWRRLTGRKANWAAATAAAQAGLKRLAGPAGWTTVCWAAARGLLGCYLVLGHNHELLLLGC